VKGLLRTATVTSTATSLVTLAILSLPVSAAAAPVSIPIELIDNLPYIPVQIGGKTVSMMLDLGADDGIQLAPGAAAQVDVVPMEGAHHFVDAKGNALNVSQFRIPTLRIGNATFKDVQSGEERFAPGYGPPDRSRGHVGSGLLRDYAVVLDYRARLMWLIPAAAPPVDRARCSGTAVSRLPDTSAIATKVGTDFGILALQWDTGAQDNFLRVDSPASHKFSAKLHDLIRSRNFTMNGTEFGPTNFYLVDFTRPLGLDGVIGYGFFARHRVCFDMPGRTIYISK
jgi:hypothetical protein